MRSISCVRPQPWSVGTQLRWRKIPHDSPHARSQLYCVFRIEYRHVVVFKPGNGSPMAKNVVVLLVVVVVLSDFQCIKAFSFHNRSSLNFAYTSKTIVLHNRTVAVFQVKSRPRRKHGRVGRHPANRNGMRVSGSDSYALLFLFVKCRLRNLDNYLCRARHWIAEYATCLLLIFTPLC